MRSLLNKKMPPGANRMAPTAPLRHGLRSGRRGRRGLRLASCESLKRWVSTDVIGCCSHTNPNNERNTHVKINNRRTAKIHCILLNDPWPTYPSLLCAEHSKGSAAARRRADSARSHQRWYSDHSSCGCAVFRTGSGSAQKALISFSLIRLEFMLCGLLNLIGLAAQRGSEYVGAQVVAGDSAVGGLLNGSAIFRRHNALCSMQPIPDIRLANSDRLSQSSLPATNFNSFFKICFHNQ